MKLMTAFVAGLLTGGGFVAWSSAVVYGGAHEGLLVFALFVMWPLSVVSRKAVLRMEEK